MKKLYSFALLFLFSFVAKAQIVNIPDASFKEILIHNLCADFNGDEIIDGYVDTNNDGEIQVAEAQAVRGLYVNAGPYIVYDLTGLNAFSNLVSLFISYTNASSIDLGTMGQLEKLGCNFNSYITTLDLSGTPNLKYLDCNYNAISSLTLTGLSSLEYLNCSSNYISTLNLSSLTNLQNFNCSYNDLLTGLDLSNLLQLKILNCKSCGLLTTLNLSGLSQLTTLDCNGGSLSTLITSGANAITHLDCSQNILNSIAVASMNQLDWLSCGANYISSLDVANLNNLTYLDCKSNHLTSLNLTGLNNLSTLNCAGNQIQTLAVSNLTLLENFYCNNNVLTSLDVTPLVNLVNLSCYNNHLNAIAVSTLTHLRTLDFSRNNIAAIDLSNLASLKYLGCMDNQLTSINLAPALHLSRLAASGNQLTTLDVSMLDYLVNIDVGGNLFTTLDFSHPTLYNELDPGNNYSYNFYNNPNLSYVNLKTGNFLVANSFNAYNCPNLHFICADEGNIQVVRENLDQNSIANVQVNSYCSFVPGGIHNTITGTLTLDANNNGCDPNDLKLKNSKITIDDGIQIGATFTDNLGNYTFYNQAGTYTVTSFFENEYFSVSPNPATLNFPAVNSSVQTQDFCITPLGIHYDVEIVLLPLGQARPGFDAQYRLVYKNKGNQLLSGSINLTFDDAILDLVSANPAVSSQSLNHLIWNYSALYPFESREIFFSLNLNSPQEIPAVNIGDVVTYVATIATNGQDETPADTVYTIDQIVGGSYDPNDKTCLEGNFITPEMVGDYLHYLIRFQNSGTAAAENIVVKDVIDTTKFDMASLQLTSSSHPQVTKITGNKVEFQFQNINLPAEIDDEPGSHGYVAFKIKTKANLALGNTVANKADIYFDYNFPIETNTATSIVALLGVNSFENTSVAATPNPTKSVVHISSKGNITSVQLHDMQGRLLETILGHDEKLDVDLSSKAKGIYFFKINTDKGMKVEKIIKE